MPIRSFFPSFVSVSPVKFKTQSNIKKNQELREEILKIRELDDKGQKWSRQNYSGGYTSYASMNRLDQFSTTFSELRNALDQNIQDFARHLELELSGRKLVMTNLWANVMNTGTVHSMHLHPLSVISGTYYVQTPKKCSALKFEDPRLVQFMGSPPRKSKARAENQRFISLEAKAGQVILFESWMKHEVPPNPSRQERISLSFNYDWI